eukprot:TRINITY_DN20568_c0_g1_i1.p1 TRINITY_DN20568_c0_g1~~TRINITY_DN20568_c0_g1_i1.p1  ORF type:complete len:282 (-),score=29.84 TRINITY_DN20568_c0_g1_i1:21-866(-)
MGPLTAVILDLDGTIIHGAEVHRNPNHPPADAYCEIFQMKTAIYMRQGLPEFLDFLFSNFVVAIWTHAHAVWAEAIMTHALPQHRDKLVFVYSATDATASEISSELKLKSLSKVFSNPEFRARGFRPESTIIIEDSPENCIENPHNAVYVPEWAGSRADDVLHGLRLYLHRLNTGSSNAVDVNKRTWLREAVSRGEVRCFTLHEISQWETEIDIRSSIGSIVPITPILPRAPQPRRAPNIQPPRNLWVPGHPGIPALVAPTPTFARQGSRGVRFAQPWVPR